MGWIPDLPDPRDYTPDHGEVRPLLEGLRGFKRRKLPRHCDLRRDGDGDYFSPVEDQGILNCSSVFACLSLVEYFERRVLGHTFEPSQLYLYKMARKLRGLSGDSGIDLRSTFKALVRYGVPPNEFWPYDVKTFDDEPRDLSLLGFTREFETFRYVRLDSANKTGADVLQAVKLFLAADIPVTFGFSVPRSLAADGDTPYRHTFDSIRGGQAVVAVGYDDHRVSTNKGALLVRSSWGEGWGTLGYGWLPYVYVERRLARDVWVHLSATWLGC